MKKILLLTSMCICIVSFTACGGKNQNVSKDVEIASEEKKEDYFILDEEGVVLGLTDKAQTAKEIVVPKEVKKIPKYTFSMENTITERVVFENPDTVFEDQFYDWQKLKNVELPENMIELPNDCFNSCDVLNAIVLPEKLEIIGEGVFEFCTSLEDVEFNDNLKEIGEKAFDSCHNLKILKFNDGLQKIGDSAFTDCTALQEIYMPETVKEIAENAFIQLLSGDEIKVYVKKGSFSDKNFETYFSAGNFIKKYY